MDDVCLQVAVPKHVCVSKYATHSLVKVLMESSEADILLVYTGENTKVFVDQIVRLLEKKGNKKTVVEYQLSAASSSEVHRLDAFCSSYDNIPVMVGIGGGSCIDSVKVVASRRKLMLLIYPTVLSSDCLTSPISVLQDGKEKVRIQSTIPDGIFIDTSVTSKAPKRLIRSGIADLMSNSSALMDLEFSTEENKSLEFASLLSKAAVNHVVFMKDMCITRQRFQGSLAQGLILSGLSMNFAGNSVTASGSEHLISHAIDYYGFGNATHGEQVYIGMLASNLIRKHYDIRISSNKVMRSLKDFGLPQKIDGYGISIEELAKATKKAPELRPARQTVLSKSRLLTIDGLCELLKPLYED